jgi:hypothetical protein
MKEKTITEFLDNEYKEFALYSIEGRAISSCIDGFKPVQRKIIHVSSQIWKTGSEKTIKVFQLSGKVASDCLHYDTEVLLASGDSIKIGDWFNNFPDLELEVVCMDSEGNIQIGRGHNPKSSLQKYIYEIETEDNKVHNLSGNHIVRLVDGSNKKVSDLDCSDEISSI